MISSIGQDETRMKVEGTERDINPYLDWLRACAALLVVVAHLRGGFFVQWSELESASQTLANYALFFITRLGREGVVVFFVLSGYLVGGHALLLWRQRGFSICRYLTARTARIYTVLIPALALTAALDCFSGAWSDRNSTTTAILNGLQLQSLLAPPYGSNAPLWTLSFEWWFYVMFGLGIAILSVPTRSQRVLFSMCLVMLVAALAIGNADILLSFPLWLMGAATMLLPRTRFRNWMGLVVLAGCLGALVFSSSRWDRVGDYAVGFGTVGVIYIWREGPACRLLAPGTFLANFSYTTYAIHLPLWILVCRVFHPERVRVAGLVEWLELVALLVLVLSACYAIYWLFERRTLAIRAWLSGHCR